MQLQKKDTNMPSTGYLETFGGYDRRAVIQEGAWSDMRNMSPRRYPAICTRPQRAQRDDAGRRDAGGGCGHV